MILYREVVVSCVARESKCMAVLPRGRFWVFILEIVFKNVSYRQIGEPLLASFKNTANLQSITPCRPSEALRAGDALVVVARVRAAAAAAHLEGQSREQAARARQDLPVTRGSVSRLPAAPPPPSPQACVIVLAFRVQCCPPSTSRWRGSIRIRIVLDLPALHARINMLVIIFRARCGPWKPKWFQSRARASCRWCNLLF